MQQQNSGMSCQLGCWALGAGVGFLLFILLLVLGDWGFIQAIFMGGVAFVVLGLGFNWVFCRDLPAARGPGNVDTSGAGDTNAPAPKAEAPSAPSPTAPPPEVPPAPTASEETSPATAKAPVVKSSTQLPGQEDLASRKGEWKYEADAAPAAEPAAAEPVAAAASEDAGDESKPEALSEARGGAADNLKEIKGVGPKLEQLLNSMGFFHFDQIANWTADEVAWVDANLVGFKGRVSRDNWVEQARILASGGETEFSKRVEDGDVY